MRNFFHHLRQKHKTAKPKHKTAKPLKEVGHTNTSILQPVTLQPTLQYLLAAVSNTTLTQQIASRLQPISESESIKLVT